MSKFSAAKWDIAAFVGSAVAGGGVRWEGVQDVQRWVFFVPFSDKSAFFL